jgi:phosphopantetheinyl transferase
MSIPAQIACRYATLAEVLGAEGERAALSPRESREISRFRHAPRARQYCGARVLSKQLLGELAGLNSADQSQIEVLSRTDAGQPTRPRVYHRGQPTDWSLSISHYGESLLLAVCLAPACRVGVDLAPLDEDLAQPISFFGGKSQDLPGSPSRPDGEVRQWAVKEAVYKACNRGEPFAPGQIRWEYSSDEKPRLCYRDVEITSSVEIRSWTVDRYVAVVVAADVRRLEESMSQGKLVAVAGAGGSP